MAIVLQETLRAVFYAPFYAAIALGAYEQEGLDVRLTRAPKPADSAVGLFTGEVDVAWGGPMRVMLTRDRDADSDLVCFAEVVTRDPFFLVGSAARPDFRLQDLVAKRLGAVSEVPTPWLCLQEDLRRVGLDPAVVRRGPERAMAENLAALRRGELEVAQLFEPFVEEALIGGAHLWYAAAQRGPTSYTCLYARRAVFEDRLDEMKAMTRALYRTQKWLAGAAPATVAQAVAPYFPEVPARVLTASLARLKSVGVWGRDPRLPRAGYERLKAGLLSGDLIRAAIPYEHAVDNTLALDVMREDPPALVV